MTWIFLLQNKSDVGIIFQEFHKIVKTQYQRSIRTLQFDNGKEFVDQVLGTFSGHHGIEHQTSCTYTPQQNELGEQKNRQIMKVVRASLFGMNMPKFYGARQ